MYELRSHPGGGVLPGEINQGVYEIRKALELVFSNTYQGIGHVRPLSRL